MKKQDGAAIVEFALMALVFFTIIFGIIEFARAFFVYNTLIEATRRGARVAAICPPNTDGINKVKDTVLFVAAGNSASTGFLGLSSSDVKVNYYEDDLSTTVTNASTGNNVDKISFVQVCIGNQTCSTPVFNHTLIIPLLGNTFQMPVFSTILPSESLGRQTHSNPLAFADRACFN